jgi:hypothetical protein
VQNLSEPVALSVTRAGDSVTFQWPAYPGGFHLESTAKLRSPPTWSIVTNIAQVDLGRSTVTIPARDSTGFFRLAQ